MAQRKGYLERLLRTGAAYQVADIVSKLIAVALLPIYTRFLTRADYGQAELILTLVILASIVVRFGVGEAFVRHHFLDEGEEHQRRVARTAVAFVLLVTTPVAIAVAVAAEPLSKLLFGFDDPTLMRAAALGLWTFSNLEIAYALLRVEERVKPYAVATLSNVAMTVALTVYLVVLQGDGAAGLVYGNFIASTAVLIGLWILERRKLGIVPHREQLPAMLRFGLPTVPADITVFALNFVDRLYLFRIESQAAAGLYALSIKLAAVVTVAVRGFQYAWPPLAYSVKDDGEASHFYARVATYYLAATGLVVCGLFLLGRWLVKLLAAPAFYPAYEALPWVGLGWAFYGFFLMLVVFAGRAEVTTRNFPAAIIGLIVNVVLLVVFVPVAGIAGAGLALCGAYVVMIFVLRLLTRKLFEVPLEWWRISKLVLVLGGIAAIGDLLMPTSGFAGFIGRAALLVIAPLCLLAVRFLSADEITAVRRLPALIRAWRRRASGAAN